MNQYLPVIKRSQLFEGMTESEIYDIISCRGGHVRKFEKGEYISREGDAFREIGLVLSGSVCLVSEDYWGNRNIIDMAGESELFGEMLAYIGEQTLSVSFQAAEACEVLFLGASEISMTCAKSCEFHQKMIQNMLRILARRALALTDRIEHTSKRTTREKLLSYLSKQSRQNKSQYFDIPFSRQQLADYLSVDRSALSNELSKLRNEGVLDFERNRFKLKA